MASTGRSASLVPFLLVGAVGCAESNPSAGSTLTTSRQDSAGVEIVMTGGLEALPRWRVGAAPELSIGSVDGGGPNALTMVSGALVRQDGSVLVSDYLPTSTRLFDSAGRFVREVVREGRGPAELRYAGAPTLLAGDSVAIFDSPQARLVLFDPSLQHVATTQLRGFIGADGQVGFPQTIISSSEALGYLMRVSRTPQPPSVRQHRTVIGRMPFNGSRFDTIAVGRGLVSYPVAEMFSSSGVFAASTHHAVGRSLLYMGETDEAAIGVWAFDGRLVRSIRWPVRSDSVTEDDRRRQFALDSAEMFASPEISRTRPALQAQVVSGLKALPVAPVLPEFTRLTPTDDGGLWIQRRPRRWLPTAEYLIADSTGALIASIELPARFGPVQIGAGAAWVLGVRRTEDDVPFVERYSIRR